MGFRLLFPNKLRAALQIAVVALFFYAGAAWPQEKVISCADHTGVLRDLYNGGFSYLSIAVTKQAIVLQTFINKETGEFVILAVSDNMACVVLSGPAIQFILGEPI